MTTKKKQTEEAAVEEKVAETKAATADEATEQADEAAKGPISDAHAEDGAGQAEEPHSGDNGAQPATEFEPSGAPLQVVEDVDPSHPAVDNDPRAATSSEQNRIDFNDPNLSGAEAVKRNLEAQSKG
ncbi:hypothetical protein [Aureimonas sp. ME7]|uniref:hypothetical protein n=1 Tax=Aureimonas sp. ME7 TaxID=2744252 RepID=UPI001FCF0370|nr:hypothetical protein [Aureimonas sp. ME7]